MTSSLAAEHPLLIGTHSGTFHADEALACFLLLSHERFCQSKIIRTRDVKRLQNLTILVDVGAEYDPKNLRFDHHQRGFQDTFDDSHDIKLSSAGLIYKHFGRAVVKRMGSEERYKWIQKKKVAGLSATLVVDDNDPDRKTAEMNETEVEWVYQNIYDSFIKPMDAIDNGINQYEIESDVFDQSQLKDVHVKTRYQVHTDLSARVSQLNPQWNEVCSEEEMYERFLGAVKLTGSELMETVRYHVTVWLPARQIVAEAMKERFNVHPSGQILVFTRERPAWHSHLHDIEKELGIYEDSNKHILYVLSEDTTNKSWRVHAAPLPGSTFGTRKGLPEPWRGIRDDALVALTGIPGCSFVHATGFIGGNQTYEGALAMAVASWEMPNLVDEQQSNRSKIAS